MVEYVTVDYLENEIDALVSVQKKREDDNARMLYDQLQTIRNRLSRLESSVHLLEHPPEPEPEPVKPKPTEEGVFRHIDYRNRGDENITLSPMTGEDVWMILGTDSLTAMFFGIVSSEKAARAGILEAARKYFYGEDPLDSIVFVEVNPIMWARHTSTHFGPLVYVDYTHLRARRADDTNRVIYAEKKKIDADLVEYEL